MIDHVNVVREVYRLGQRGVGWDEKSAQLSISRKAERFCTRLEGVQCYVQRSQHQGNRAEQLDQHVE